MNCYFRVQYYVFKVSYCYSTKAFFMEIKYSNEIMSTFGHLVFIKIILLYGGSNTATITKLFKCLSLSGNLIRGVLQLKLSI